MNSDAGNILGIFAFLTSAAGLIYAAINHKRIRCRCCGKDLDMSVDVDPTVVVKPTITPVLDETISVTEQEKVPEEEVEQEQEPEEREEQIIQYVEPQKRSKKSRVYPN